MPMASPLVGVEPAPLTQTIPYSRTRIFYDCEFRENGRTIDLISIGMVAEDGREYYAVVADAPWKRIREHEWLMANVVPYLPRDPESPQAKLRKDIAREVAEFLLAGDGKPELWAYYGAYDHVVLCQLFGAMIDLPSGVPMWTNDLKQEAARLGNPELPKQSGVEHNALADARWVREATQFLEARHAAA